MKQEDRMYDTTSDAVLAFSYACTQRCCMIG